MFGWLVWRDLILAWRRRADVLATLFFFVIVTSLFPLGIGPEREVLRTIAPGVVWVAALLASMLSLGRTFGNDYQDGTLEPSLTQCRPSVVLAKSRPLDHAELPRGVAPVRGLQFSLSRILRSLLFSLLNAGLDVIGSIGAALTLGLRAANVLVALLVTSHSGAHPQWRCR
jgi:heme exporter protein B